MSGIEVSGQGKIGFTGSPQVGGDVNIDQSKHKNVNVTYAPSIQHDGIIGAFNFDLQGLQSEEIIAKRVDELEKIRSKLEHGTKTGIKIAILKGIGGSGKTTLAKMYADDERPIEPFKNLIWIDAEDSTKVVDNFRQILNIITPGEETFIGRKLADAVYNSILKHKTLIVFDNVENVEDISDFLPTVTKVPWPQFIITTRNDLKMPGYRNNWVHVNVLSLEVSRAYIREKLDTSQLKIPDVDEKWEELATYFGQLVIALRAATSSIIQQNEKQQFWDEDEQQVYMIEMYLSEIKQVDILHVNENDADSNDPAEITYKPLRQIWTKTLDDLANRPQNLTVQLGERILEVLAFLSPTGVPERWFRTLLQNFLDSNEMTLTTEMNADAKRLLASMSLVELSGGKLVIHRLLQTTLLSRLNAAPNLKFESLNWLLPAITKLYSRLRDENRLQNFHSNMDHLLINISTDLLENVPDLAVSFLVQLNPLGREFCKKLLKKLIRSVFEERVLVSRDSLNLLVTSPQVVEIVLLLPMWLRECGENVSAGEQLLLVNKILNLKVNGWITAYPFDVPGAGKIYLTIAEVLAKWEPEVETTKDNFEVAQNAISLVNQLCTTISKAMDSKQLCLNSYYRNLNSMFSKLKKCLVTALTVIFSQRVTRSQNVEAMLNSVQVAVRWFITLDKYEFSFEIKPSKTLDISQLDDILAQTGIDCSMVEFNEAQLQCCYNMIDSIRGYPSGRNKGGMQLAARMAASFSAILEKCSSDRKQNKIHHSTLSVAELHLQRRSYYVPLEVIPLLEALANWERCWFRTFKECSDLLGKGQEPNLPTLKTSYQIDDSDRCRISFQSLADALRRFHDYCRCGSADGTENAVFKRFMEDYKIQTRENFPQTVAEVLPNWSECANVADAILKQYKPMKSSMESLSLIVEKCEDCSNPRQLVETFEKYYIVVETGSDRSKFGEVLQEASVLIQDPTNTPTCDCLVSRCQRMLAGLSLEEGNIEYAIAEASKAFEHQLYCAASYSNLMKTVQVLLDAYREYEDAQTRSKKLFGRIITEHEGWLNLKSRFGDPKRVQPTLWSQSSLMRYLCSVGSLQEAAEVGEKFGFGLPQSFSDEFGQNFLDLDGLLIVALFLILRGDSDRAMRTLECDHLNRKFTDQDYHRYHYDYDPFFPVDVKVVSNERSSFLLALKQIAASISSDSQLPSEFHIKSFRKGAFVCANICQDYKFIHDWVDDKQDWELTDRFKPTKRATWCEKRFGNDELDRDYIALLWFDTMETLLFQKRKVLDETLFTTLERQLEFKDTGRHFKYTDSTTCWGIKCLLGMYRRKELWFQKSEVHRGLVDQAAGGAEEGRINIGISTLIKGGMPAQKSSKSWLRSLGLSK